MMTIKTGYFGCVLLMLIPTIKLRSHDMMMPLMMQFKGNNEGHITESDCYEIGYCFTGHILRAESSVRLRWNV